MLIFVVTGERRWRGTVNRAGRWRPTYVLDSLRLFESDFQAAHPPHGQSRLLAIFAQTRCTIVLGQVERIGSAKQAQIANDLR
jgi:hypothetical protein